MIEIWKEIKDYPNYEISNLGRVKSSYRRGRIMDCNSLDTGGYRKLGLRKNNIPKTFRVCVLVAKHFLSRPKTEYKLEVNHKNGLKTDDRVSNLEWCSHIYNMKHAWGMGLIPKPFRDSKGKFVPSNIKVCKSGHILRGIGTDDICPECEEAYI